MTSTPKFKPNWFQWPIQRIEHPFRMVVVEPRDYAPAEHAEIFNAALSSLISPEVFHIDPFDPPSSSQTIEPFDLATFPEAFLPMNDLLDVIMWVQGLESMGCVHVGLRPSSDPGQHLFNTSEAKQLIDTLLSNKYEKINHNDLLSFFDWLGSQSTNDQFNIACLFTVDAHQEIRICLHPKVIRSKYETSPLPEHHMTTGNLLTLVTLQPIDKSFLSITIQPLICADALFLETDWPRFRPLDAANSDIDSSAPQPDHIDIISVTTCTPQTQHPISNSGCRQWHQEFRNSFVRTARDHDLIRHHNSVFLLSNYSTVSGSKRGGLSGIFVPIPLNVDKYPEFMTFHTFGRPKSSPESDNVWSTPTDGSRLDSEWSSLGYVATLEPDRNGSSEVAYMLKFTIQRLIRHTTHWPPNSNKLTEFRLMTASCDSSSGKLVFRKREPNAQR